MHDVDLPSLQGQGQGAGQGAGGKGQAADMMKTTVSTLHGLLSGSGCAWPHELMKNC